VITDGCEVRLISDIKLLFLFDLGYFSYLFLHQLNEAGVWFVCWLKANSAPIITRVIKGVAKRYMGSPLNKHVNLRGSIVEVWAKLMLPGKVYFKESTFSKKLY